MNDEQKSSKSFKQRLLEDGARAVVLAGSERAGQDDGDSAYNLEAASLRLNPPSTRRWPSTARAGGSSTATGTGSMWRACE